MNNQQNDITGYPSDWRAVRLADHVQINPESLGSGTPDEYEFRYIDISSVERGTVDWAEVETHTYESGPSRARRIVRPRDVLLSTVRPSLQGHTYADWSRSGEFVCSTGFAVLRAGAAVEPSYLRHLVFSDIVDRQLRERTTGSNYPAVRSSDVKELEILLPETPEQRRIADVLDTVDAAIQETDRVVEKQEQVKTGLLQDLLTRGLDADGHLRTLEREPEAFRETELGKLPKEWKTVRLGEILHGIQAGKSPSCPDIPSSSGEWGVVKVSAIRPEGFQSEENKVVEDESHIRPEYEIEDGDLLISRANTSDLVGITCLVNDPLGKLMLCDKSLRLVVNQKVVNARYLFQATQVDSFRRQVEAAGTGSSGTMKNISQADIRGFQVPLPSIREQLLIADRVEGLTRKIDSEKLYRRKLQRLKTGLMQDLLTGQVRVPEAEDRVDELVA